MATDPTQIELTLEQKRLVANASEQSGKPWPELLASALKQFVLPAEPSANSARTLHDAFVESGALGCYDGPADLSSNPKHMEGFGQSDD